MTCEVKKICWIAEESNSFLSLVRQGFLLDNSPPFKPTHKYCVPKKKSTRCV